MVESSDKTWSTGEGNGKPLQSSYLKNPMNNMKRQKDTKNDKKKDLNDLDNQNSVITRLKPDPGL